MGRGATGFALIVQDEQNKEGGPLPIFGFKILPILAAPQYAVPRLEADVMATHWQALTTSAASPRAMLANVTRTKQALLPLEFLQARLDATTCALGAQPRLMETICGKMQMAWTWKSVSTMTPQNNASTAMMDHHGRTPRCKNFAVPFYHQNCFVWKWLIFARVLRLLEDG